MSPVPGTPPAELLEQPPVDPTTPTSYGQDNRDLPEQIVNVLAAVIKEFQGQDKWARRREVRKDRKLRFYEAGYQHLYFPAGGSCFTLMTGGGTYSGQNGSIQCPTYQDAYNIFLRFFLIVQAVLTQTLPAVRWQPLDPSNPDDIDKNKEAQNFSKLFDRFNDMKDLAGQIIRMMGLSGRTLEWTRTEQDSQRFGFEDDGVTAKAFQRTTIHGTLETKLPITCREMDATCLYVLLREPMDVKVAKDRWNWKADQIKEGAKIIGDSNYESYAILGALNGGSGQFLIGDTLSHMVIPTHAFLRPASFCGPEYDVPLEGGSGLTLKQALMQLFPQGCRAVFVGDTYVASYPESMDDHLDVQFPYQGDGMFRQGFMEVMAIVQDNFNDLCNWLREKVDTGAGETFVNGTQDEVDAVTSQRAAPNAIRPGKQFKPPNEPLSNGFYKTPDPDIPETLFKLLEFMRGDLPEFLLAALPSLQGGDMSDNGTASGYAMATANAKGQLGILYSRMQRMFARIRYQSALAASRDESKTGVVKIPGSESGSTISVDFDVLKKGNFGCYPDEDSSFPETVAQKRMILKDWQTVAIQSPEVAALMDNPDNIEQAIELNGFSEMVFIPAEARTKQLFEIEQMLQEAPVPPDPMMVEQMQMEHAAVSLSAQSAGGAPQPFAPPPSQPSVPVQQLDFHQYEFAKCQEWLSSKARRDEDKKGNQAGVQNVILHALAHQAIMQQMVAAQAAMAPEQPEGKPGKPSPPSEKKPTPGTQVPQGA